MPSIGMTVLPKTWALTKEARERGLINCIEFVPDAYINSWKGTEDLKRIIDFFQLPYSFHFTSHSLCSTDFRQEEKLNKTRSFLESFDPILVSDHLSCSRHGIIDLESNIGTIYNQESVSNTVRNIRYFIQTTNVDKKIFLVEHIPSYYLFKESDHLPEAFLNDVIKKSHCGLLLDLHNLYVDEINRGIDAEKVIESLPAESVKEIHLAGGSWINKAYLDSHDNDISSRVFELLAIALKKFSPRLINLERESRFTNLENVLTDLEKINNICKKVS